MAARITIGRNITIERARELGAFLGDKFVVAVEKEEGTGFRYDWFNHWADAADYFIKTTQEPHFHEVVKANGMYKFYMDIDIERAKVPQGEDMMSLGDRIVELCIMGFEAVCVELGHTFDITRDVALYNSHGPNKYSMHIIFPCHVTENTAGRMKYFANMVVDVVREKPDIVLALEKNFIDLGVYGRNRNFRLCGSRKVGSDRVVAPQDSFTYGGRKIDHVRFRMSRAANERFEIFRESMLTSDAQSYKKEVLNFVVPERPRNNAVVEGIDPEALVELACKVTMCPSSSLEVGEFKDSTLSLVSAKPFYCPVCSQGEPNREPHDSVNPFITIWTYEGGKARHATFCCSRKLETQKNIYLGCLDEEVGKVERAEWAQEMSKQRVSKLASLKRGKCDGSVKAVIAQLTSAPTQTLAITPTPGWVETGLEVVPRRPSLVEEMAQLRGNPKTDEKVKKSDLPGYNLYDKKFYWSDFWKNFQDREFWSYDGRLITKRDNCDEFDAMQKIVRERRKIPKSQDVTCDVPKDLLGLAQRVIAVINDSAHGARFISKNRDKPVDITMRGKLAASTGGSCRLITYDPLKREFKTKRFQFMQFLSMFEAKLSYDRLVVEPYPNDPDGLLPDPEVVGSGEFNAFPGIRAQIVEMTPERRARIQPFLDHLMKYTAKGDPVIYRWILWWFHRVIVKYQRPDMMLMFTGKQGSGKSIIFRIFGDILGNDLYLSIGTLDEFLKDFNKLHSQKLLIYIQEFGKSKGDQSSQYDKFKSRIDQDRVSVEAKHVDVVQEENRAGIGATSNNVRIIKSAMDDRRSIFVGCANEIKDDDEYWERFLRMYPKIKKNPGLNLEISNILYSFMHSKECTDLIYVNPEGGKYKYFRPPMTASREEIIAGSRNSAQKYLAELEAGARRLLPGDIVKTARSGYFMLSDRVWDAFADWMNEKRVIPRYQMTKDEFLVEVRDHFGVRSTQINYKGRRPYGYKITEEMYHKLTDEFADEDSNGAQA